MEEAEELCDKLLVMNKGQAVAEGSPAELIEQHVGREVIEFAVGANEIEYYVQKIQGKFTYQVMRNHLKLFVRGQQDAKDVIKEITSSNISMRKASLNDVFLKISGSELHD